MTKNKKHSLHYDYLRAHQLAAEGRLMSDPALVPGAECPPPSDLMDFAFGALDAETAKDMEPHVSGCPYCARCLKVYRAATGTQPATGYTVVGGTVQAQ